MIPAKLSLVGSAAASTQKFEAHLRFVPNYVGVYNWILDTHHFVDGGDDLEHLLPRDEPIAVQVVHGEGPLQLLLQLSPGSDAECT